MLNVAVMSNVAPTYAPPGAHLVVAALPGHDGDTIEADARSQLRGWWGSQVDTWDHLATYRIAHGQPRQRPPFQPEAAGARSPTVDSCAATIATPPRSRERCTPDVDVPLVIAPTSARLTDMSEGTPATTHRLRPTTTRWCAESDSCPQSRRRSSTCSPTRRNIR